jgi:2-polyprenyl-6-methoxyphenol hydroxylase-like FAD-dependent oxidoreductase
MQIVLFISLMSLLISQLVANPLEKESLRVLVVGAGPSGLCIVKALQNCGIHPDIIEKEKIIRSDGAGIAIPANGTWALNQLGINIASNAYLIRNMQFTDHRGELLVQENIETIHLNGSQFYSLSRDKFINLLLSSLQHGTPIQTSTTIERFSEEADQIKVEFSNGQINDYDLVIGCDGIHSSLRLQVHPNEISESLNLLAWRTLVDTPIDITMPIYMLGTDRAALLYPMPGGKTYVYGQIFQPVKCPPLHSFSEEFSSFGGHMPQVLSSLDEHVKFYIHHMERSHSVRFKLDGFKRVLLVGDAAHAFGPMLQNGAAQAFEDAFALQDLLTGSVSKEAIPALIDKFEARRFARVQMIFAMSNIKIQSISDPQQIMGRNEAIRRTGAPNVQGFKLIMKENP